MSLTCSIWLALLLRGLEAGQSKDILVAALKLLKEMQQTLEPMKSCLIKPLNALTKAAGLDEEVLDIVKEIIAKFGLIIPGLGKKPPQTSSVSVYCLSGGGSSWNRLSATQHTAPLCHLLLQFHWQLLIHASSPFLQRSSTAIYPSDQELSDTLGIKLYCQSHTRILQCGCTISFKQLWKQVQSVKWLSLPG
jgi:hypothetical protein